MNGLTFKIEMARLAKVFGEKHYPNERKDILFNLVQDLPDKWMKETVDHLIVSCQLQYPPLWKEFQERINIERERGWSSEKDENDKFYKKELPIDPDAPSKIREIRMNLLRSMPAVPKEEEQ